MKKDKSSKKKSRGTGLMIVGLLLIVAALLLSVYNYMEDQKAGLASEEIEDMLEEVIQQHTETPEEPTDQDNPYANLPEMEGQEIVVPDMETTEIKGYDYIGILEIPALHIKLPVMEEWDYTRLRISPCRYSGSYYTDDLVIAGHNYRKHFSPIRSIKPGTDVYFINPAGTVYHYQVDFSETLQPTQVEDLVFGDADLTLFTCHIGGRTRCVVRCSRVDK